MHWGKHSKAYNSIDGHWISFIERMGSSVRQAKTPNIILEFHFQFRKGKCSSQFHFKCNLTDGGHKHAINILFAPTSYTFLQPRDFMEISSTWETSSITIKTEQKKIKARKYIFTYCGVYSKNEAFYGRFQRKRRWKFVLG